MAAPRNAPCPCGSGKKYKNCCAGKAPWYKQPMWSGALLALVLLGGMLLVGLAFRSTGSDGASGGAPGPAPPGKVWSAEHGHWHDAP